MVVLAVLIAAPRVARSEPLHFRTPSTCTTDGGSTVRLDPGYYLSEFDYAAVDDALRKAEDERTRLRAENESLRKSAKGPGLAWLGTAIAAIIAYALK